MVRHQLLCTLILFLCCSISLSDSIEQAQSPPLTATAPPPPFLVATEGVLKDAVTSLFSSVGNSNFKNAATRVVRSEVRLLGKAVHGIKRFLSDFSTLGLKINDYESKPKQDEHLEAPSQLLESSTPIPTLSDDFSGTGLIIQAKSSTPFATFWSSIATSFALTFITELGDRTFFIAALLSLKHPKLIVLFGTCLALVIQTVFSTLVGQLLHMLPSNAATNTFLAFPLDDYAAAVLLFVFAFIHLRAAWNPQEEEDSVSFCSEKQTHSCTIDDVYVGCPEGPENDEDVNYKTPQPADKISDASDCSALKTPLSSSVFDPYESKALVEDSHSRCQCDSTMSCEKCRTSSNATTSSTDDSTTHSQSLSVVPSTQQREVQLQPTGDIERRRSTRAGSLLEPPVHKNRELKEAEKATRALELRRLGSEPPKAFEVFKETFWVIFVAELGDKSMISTVALAAAQNPYGVFVGSSCAHCIVTLLAVIAGSLLEGFISERIANIIGAVLFLAFGVMTTLEGLARQGIRLWWFLGEKASALFVAYFFTMKNMAVLGGSSAATASSHSSSSMIDGMFRMIVS